MKQADLIPVENSSNVKARHYDAASKKLTVQFKGDLVYQYAEVPPELWQQWLAADSAGSFFHAGIRQQFDCEPITLED